MKFFCIMPLLGALSSNAFAGPFGFEMGMSQADLSKLGVAKKHDSMPTTTILEKLKNGHPDIEEYWVTSTPKTGLCRVTAWTPTIKTSGYGDQLKSQYESFRTALTEKYGAGKNYDFLRSKSIWNEAKEWTISLWKGERYLASVWNHKDLPDHLSTIGVEAKATDQNNGLVSITYEFDNFEECMRIIKSQKNSNL